MSDHWVDVRVDDGSFIISDGGEIAVETLDLTTGLIGTMDIGAMVTAGIHTGHVKVCATVVAGPPESDDFADWDEVVEVSVYAPRGELRVSSVYFGPPDELPRLSYDGPGWYRLRVFARGRDTPSPDVVQNDSAERYSLTCWRAPRSTPLIIRATDRKGRGLRASQVKHIDAPASPVSENSNSQAELQRQNLRRAARKPD
ncbi:hypothetical protein AB0A70_29800 [Streptomyces morookaense]|uniref:hypothetical protein n=1 Tax=Streptomyces morookaense TaxID=1970 RepID=UPI0033E122AE